MSIARARNIALAAAILLASVEPVVSEPWDEATAALGRGDYATALRLMRPFAEQGDPRAQFNFGVSHEQGLGVNQDDAEALKWYKLAAEQGYSLAQHNLAGMYGNGRGVRQDFAEALKWYRLAAAQGNAFSQNSLGLMYEKGQGVPQSNVKAHMWFNLAGARDFETGLKNRIRIAAQMSREQVAEAQQLARDWNPAE